MCKALICKALIQFIKNMNQIKPKYIYTALLVLVLALTIFKIYQVKATTTTTLFSYNSLYQYKIFSTDVANATSVNGDNSYKKLVVKTMDASSYLQSIVNKVVTVFRVPTNDAIYVDKIIVEDASGNQLSTNNVAYVPVSLNQKGTYLENRPGEAIENGFYSETNAVNIVYYIRCPYNCNLNDLSAGELDVYMIRLP